MKRALVAILILALVALGGASAEGADWGEDLAGVLMADVPSDADIEGGGGTVLGSDISRWEVRSITFVDELGCAPGDAWDVSAARDGSVLAWVEPCEGGMYDLTVGAQGGVIANPESSYLFHGYLLLEEIDFNGCFHTERAERMCGMFEWCASLRDLDLSGFDTRNVWDMTGMFLSCVGLESLELGRLDTSRVEGMGYMFTGCVGLRELDVTSFDTRRAYDMRGMFCALNLESLDLRSFEIGGVEHLDMMFYNCDRLSEILVTEDGWVIGAGATVEDMYTNCPAAA